MTDSRKQSGAGLPEVLVALVVLAIGITGSMVMMTRGIHLARHDIQARETSRRMADSAELRLLQPYMTTELHEQLRDELTTP